MWNGTFVISRAGDATNMIKKKYAPKAPVIDRSMITTIQLSVLLPSVSTEVVVIDVMRIFFFGYLVVLIAIPGDTYYLLCRHGLSQRSGEHGHGSICRVDSSYCFSRLYKKIEVSTCHHKNKEDGGDPTIVSKAADVYSRRYTCASLRESVHDVCFCYE